MNINAQEALKEYREKIRTGEIEKPPQKTPLDTLKTRLPKLRLL